MKLTFLSCLLNALMFFFLVSRVRGVSQEVQAFLDWKDGRWVCITEEIHRVEISLKSTLYVIPQFYHYPHCYFSLSFKHFLICSLFFSFAGSTWFARTKGKCTVLHSLLFKVESGSEEPQSHNKYTHNTCLKISCKNASICSTAAFCKEFSQTALIHF